LKRIDDKHIQFSLVKNVDLLSDDFEKFLPIVKSHLKNLSDQKIDFDAKLSIMNFFDEQNEVFLFRYLYFKF
jgi:hypothetical protein